MCPFVLLGQQSYLKQKKTSTNNEDWNGVWEIAAYLPGCEQFFLIPMRKIPDIVVWCAERKIVNLVELQDNINAAQVWKE